MSPLTSVSASRIALGVHHQTAVSEGLLMAESLQVPWPSRRLFGAVRKTWR